MFFKTADKFQKIFGNDAMEQILPDAEKLKEILSRLSLLKGLDISCIIYYLFERII